MSKSIEITGDKEFIAFLKDALKHNERELDRTLQDMARRVESEAKRTIQGGARSGRVYKRGGKNHKASAPNEAPKTDTGQLVANITTERKGFMNYDVGSRRGAPHGFWLEFGTRNMAKRPWLTPAYNKIVRKARNIFNG